MSLMITSSARSTFISEIIETSDVFDDVIVCQVIRHIIADSCGPLCANDFLVGQTITFARSIN